MAKVAKTVRGMASAKDSALASLLALVAALFAAVAVAPASATAPARTMHAVVIGIDDYADREGILQDLHGAVNDARDIADTLRAIGVEDVTLLLDAAARRPQVLKAWQDALGRSAPGDLLVLTYAGHGMQRVAGADSTEADNLDEFLALHGFERTGTGLQDFILDDEINAFVRRAAEQEVEVVLLLDSCHSGTAYRSVDRRARPRYRFSSVKVEGDLLAGLPADDLFAGLGTDDQQPAADLLPENLFQFSAVLDDKLAPEITLPDADGRPTARGAMSYFFARGLRGAADEDRNGEVRFDELKRYMLRNITTATEGSQVPDIAASPSKTASVIMAQSAAGPVPAPPPDRPVLLAVHGGGSLPDGLVGIQAVSANDGPDLIWDAARQEMVSGINTVVAQRIGPEDLQGIIDKWRARLRLAFLGERDSIEIATVPAKPTFRSGESVTLRIDNIAYPHLVVVNLANNGEVQLLYPLNEREMAARIPDGQFEIGEIVVEGPFGADLLVAVATDGPVDHLAREIKAVDGKPRPLVMAEAIEKWLTGANRQVGIFSFYTCDGEAAPC